MDDRHGRGDWDALERIVLRRERRRVVGLLLYGAALAGVSLLLLSGIGRSGNTIRVQHATIQEQVRTIEAKDLALATIDETLRRRTLERDEAVAALQTSPSRAALADLNARVRQLSEEREKLVDSLRRLDDRREEPPGPESDLAPELKRLRAEALEVRKRIAALERECDRLRRELAARDSTGPRDTGPEAEAVMRDLREQNRRLAAADSLNAQGLAACFELKLLVTSGSDGPVAGGAERAGSIFRRAGKVYPAGAVSALMLRHLPR